MCDGRQMNCEMLLAVLRLNPPGPDGGKISCFTAQLCWKQQATETGPQLMLCLVKHMLNWKISSYLAAMLAPSSLLNIFTQSYKVAPPWLFPVWHQGATGHLFLSFLLLVSCPSFSAFSSFKQSFLSIVDSLQPINSAPPTSAHL